MNIYARGPEPVAGNTLFYNHKGILQAVKLTERLYTMPITKDGSIVGYCYANHVPDFLFMCQYVAVPHTGGAVAHKINVSNLVAALPRYVATIIPQVRQNLDHIGQTFSRLFGFAQVEFPKNGAIRMAFPLQPSQLEKFKAEFITNFAQINVSISSMTFEPQTKENWEY